MAKDPVQPILSPNQYTALERRLTHVILAINKCLTDAKSVNDVIRTSYDDPQVPKPGSVIKSKTKKKTGADGTADDEDDEDEDEE
jgi:hypothetical protein